MSIKKNYIYNTANQLLTMLVSIITIPYVSRVLGVENIGIHSYAYSIISYFVLFIALGLNNYGNREIAKKKDDNKKLNETFSSIYCMQLCIGVVVTIIYLSFIAFFVHENKIIYQIQTIYLIAATLDINWAMYGLEVFKYTAIRNMIISALNLALIFIFVRDNGSLNAYCLILALGTLANQLASWFYIKGKIKVHAPSLKNIAKHIKPNLILFLPIIAVSIYKIMDKIMLGGMTTMAQVGYYESSEKIIRIPTILISSLGMVMLPRMANLYSKNDTKTTKKYMQKSIDMAMLLSSSLCFGIMCISKEFVPIFYGDGFDTCIGIYLALLPSCLFLAFSNVIRTQYLIPKSKDKIYIKGVFVGAAVNLVANLILIPKMMAIGAAVGTLIAEASVCISQAIDVRKDLRVGEYVKRSTPFVLLGIAMFALVFPLSLNMQPIYQMIAKIALGASIYIIGVAVLLKITDVYDIYPTIRHKH